MTATYTVAEVAELAGVSDWTLRQAIHRGDCPFPFLHLGRRIVAPRTKVDAILGLGVASDLASPNESKETSDV